MGKGGRAQRERLGGVVRCQTHLVRHKSPSRPPSTSALSLRGPSGEGLELVTQPRHNLTECLKLTVKPLCRGTRFLAAPGESVLRPRPAYLFSCGTSQSHELPNIDVFTSSTAFVTAAAA